jgi:hypothetical protein
VKPEWAGIGRKELIGYVPQAGSPVIDSGKLMDLNGGARISLASRCLRVVAQTGVRWKSQIVAAANEFPA